MNLARQLEVSFGHVKWSATSPLTISDTVEEVVDLARKLEVSFGHVRGSANESIDILA